MTEPGLHEEFLEGPTYTFLKTVGSGAGGKSRLWMNEVLGIRVVSKTVDTFGLAGGLAKSEPRILVNLRHPRLVRVWEAQFDPAHDPSLKVVTFTTTYCEGRSVATALEEGHNFSIADALRVGADILDALAYLHEDKRYLHRDVKSGNVMLDADRRRAFLGDLGSAAELDENDEAPAAGCTLAYRPPEHRTGAMSPASDVYGVGMMLVEMLNGPFPWDEMDGDKMEDRLAKGLRTLPDRHFRLAPWVPGKVARVIRRMTDRDPAARPTAAAALRDIGDAGCVDWCRTNGSGLTGSWEGRYPPNVPARRARMYRVVAEPVTSGRYKGQVKLSASWRDANSLNWRNYAKLLRRAAAGDDAALSTFFRDVERLAQEAPAR